MRVLLRRTVFLLTGAAVSVAVLILAMLLSAPLPAVTSALMLFVPVWLLLGGAIGLLPGVRELEVAGARDLLLLGADEVVVPERVRWEHRWRTALWVLGHQLVGLLTGLALTTAVLAVLLLGLLATGPREVDAGDLWSGSLPTGSSAVAIAAGCVAALALAAVVVVLAGRAAVAVAPVLLGPTSADRLVIVEQRLARGREHLRLSQDLHDGVGHSLSAISLQAAAAERVAAGGGDVGPALTTIRQLAAGAVAELEQALVALREEADGRGRLDEQRDLRDLPDLVAAHRERGARVELVTTGVELPAVVGRTAHRVAAEGLANAEKHAPGQPVRLVVTDGEELTITISNPAPQAVPTGDGHGIAGLREQVTLLGGRLRVGPQDGVWALCAHLPKGGRRGR